MAFKDEIAFTSWCQRLGYGERTVALIERIRTSPPARNVTGGRGNVHGRLPSYKMGVTVQSESRTAEKPGIRVFYEYDDMINPPVEERVIEYYDQPDKIVLKYVSASGRNMTTWHTPDFFVIRENGASWEEWKAEAELVKLAEKQPNRYQKDEWDHWRCPPGETYAATFGLAYHLRSNAEINWDLFSNLEFLHEYLAEADRHVTPVSVDALIAYIGQHQGIPLDRLLRIDHVEADDVYMLIAHKQIFVDLTAARLVHPERVQVYTSQDAVEAHRQLQSRHQYDPTWQVLDLMPGTQLNWDGQRWELVNLGVSEVRLRHLETQRIQVMPHQEFASALMTGEIANELPLNETNQPHPAVQAIWAAATEADYAIANCRLQVLNALDAGQTLEDVWAMEDIRTVLGELKSPRTIRHWRKQFADAERAWGNGYAGLLPRITRRGNRQRKLPDATLEKMQTFIENRYEDLRQPYATSVWVEYQSACEAEGISPASLKTFGKEVQQRPLDIQTRKRQGKRAAHQVAKRYWQLEATTPKHGERVWHIVHLDHTRLDIELRHSKTGKNLGRPWATFAVDAYSRRLLAVVLSLDDNPSYRNCMMVLREMVRRFHRLPQIIYVDNGEEFKSTYFQALLAQYGVEVAYRPPGQPRFGDVVERLFRTTNTQFLYNLTGNTQISKEVRLMTKSNDPRNLAVWNLDWLYLALREWAYEIYDQSEHASLHQSPREAFEDSLRQHGERAFKWIDYPTFILNALPAPDVGRTRKVQPSGVRINHIYYWHDLMYQPAIAGTSVPVRCDPFNVGIAYAYLNGGWVRCTSEYFAIFKDRSDRELQVVKEELRASFRRHGQVVYTLNAKLLADFLERVVESEDLLKQQLRDNAMQFTRAGINDNLSDETMKTRLRESAMDASAESDTSAPKLPLQPAIHPVETGKYGHLELPGDF